MNGVSVEYLQDGNNPHELTHWHEGIEVIRAVDHPILCIINGIECELQEDEICIINRRQIHRLISKDGKPCTFHYLFIDPALFTADRIIHQHYVVPLLADENFTFIHAKHGQAFTDEYRNLMDMMLELQLQKPLAYELKVIGLIFIGFQCLYRHYAMKKGERELQGNPDTLLYRRILGYIYQEYADKLTLDSISAAGNISKSKCCRLFREYAGRSPIDFLNLYRLKISCDLLKNTNQSISAIAAACGFGQQSYYNRLFLRQYGVTPGQFRQKLEK